MGNCCVVRPRGYVYDEQRVTVTQVRLNRLRPGGPHMAKNDSDNDREKKIENLKRRAEKLAGGKMQSGGSEDCSPELQEEFWKQVVEFEEAGWTTHFQQLERAGITLPAPETLNDREVTVKLWEVINKLAQLRVFLEDTDHLSDRELYTKLWSDILREETKDIILDETSACHIQLLGTGSEEDTHLYLKYFADEKWRKDWHEQFPDYPIPAHEDPAYDRDRYLPKPNYGAPCDSEIN